MCLGAGPTTEVFHKEDLSRTEDSLLSTTDLHLHISIQIHYELPERERETTQDAEILNIIICA